MKSIKIFISILMLFVCINTNPISAKEKEHGTGYIQSNYKPQKRQSQDKTTLRRAAALDVSYKSPVTSVKDQGAGETCWAFAYLAMAESNMKKNKGVDYDLSERQLAYFTYNHVNDPLGNTKNDENYLGNSWYKGGGNAYYTSLVLSGYVGAINESLAPYSSEGITNNDLAYKNNSVILKNAYFLDGNSRNEVKQAIVDNGGVVGAYCAFNSYYDNDNGTHYSDVKMEPNHEVCLVGWNDNFDKNKFKVKPKNNGAWLIKNSWGDQAGENGYIWISYEDKTLCDFVTAKFDSASSYKHNYHYDASICPMVVSLKSGTSIANIYQAKGNTSGNEETLKAVSFGVDSTDTSYSIQIYKNLKSKSNPQSGSVALSKAVTGKTTYSGIYTVDLNQTVKLAQGEYYSVVITLKSPNGVVSPFIETDYYDSYSYFDADLKENQSFYKTDEWYDAYYEEACFRIKALTNDLSTKDINTAGVSGYSSSYYYTSKAIVPNITVKYGSKTLKKGTDYTVSYLNNTKVGTPTIKITGKGQYLGTKTIKFKIVKKPVSKLTIKGVPKTKTYTGKKIKPSIKVYNGKVLLKNKTHYTITYGKNTSTGKATIKITGKGNYSGSVTKTFYIVPKKVSIKKVTSPSKKKITVTYKKATGASGYQIAYKKVGTKTWKYTTTSSLKKTISGLTRKKKYDVKVRAYKKVGSKKYYGTFSASKRVKVK